MVETSLDTLLADALREATGTEIALSNGFRFGHPIVPGPIRERDLWMLFPVSTHLRVGTVTGAQLRAFWESEIDHVFADDPTRLFGGWLPRVSGMTVRFRSDRPRGQRVLSIAVNGEPLEDERVYSIAACEREGDTDAADAAERGPIRAIEGGRVIAEDLPPRVLSQYERR